MKIVSQSAASIVSGSNPREIDGLNQETRLRPVVARELLIPVDYRAAPRIYRPSIDDSGTMR